MTIYGNISSYVVHVNIVKFKINHTKYKTQYKVCLIECIINVEHKDIIAY